MLKHFFVTNKDKLWNVIWKKITFGPLEYTLRVDSLLIRKKRCVRLFRRGLVQILFKCAGKQYYVEKFCLCKFYIASAKI